MEISKVRDVFALILGMAQQQITDPYATIHKGWWYPSFGRRVCVSAACQDQCVSGQK